MNSLFAMLQAYPLYCVQAGLMVFFDLAAAGVPLLAIACLAMSGTRRLNLHLARQLSALGATLHGLVLLGAVTWGLLAPRLPGGGRHGHGLASLLKLDGYVWWNSPYRRIALAVLALCAVAFLVLMLLSMLWTKLRGSMAVLWLGELLAAFLSLGKWAGIFCGLWHKPGVFPAFFQGGGFYPLLWTLFFMGIGISGAAAMIWLLLRRSRDDFGRDYYAFAARKCARFAGWSGLVALPGLMLLIFCCLMWMVNGGIAWNPSVLLDVSALRGLFSQALSKAAILAWLLPVMLAAPVFSFACGGFISGASVPMRRKLSMMSCWLCWMLAALALIRLLFLLAL